MEEINIIMIEEGFNLHLLCMIQSWSSMDIHIGYGYNSKSFPLVATGAGDAAYTANTIVSSCSAFLHMHFYIIKNFVFQVDDSIFILLNWLVTVVPKNFEEIILITSLKCISFFIDRIFIKI